MTNIRMEIQGLNKLFRKMKATTKDSIIRRGLYAGALHIAGWIKAKRLSGARPKYLGVITGRLRSSITAGKTIKRANQYIATIGTNVVYARVHEFGYPKRKIPKRPFLRPGIEDKRNQQRVLGILKSLIQQAQARA